MTHDIAEVIHTPPLAPVSWNVTMVSSEVAHDLAPNFMSQKKPNRFYTGVSFEPEVSAYLDELAIRMGMSRSWVLNTIVYEYAKMVEKKNLMPLVRRLEVQGSKEIVIRA